MNKVVYKIDDNNISFLTNLEINELFPIQDNNNNKMIISQLVLNDQKLFLETCFLKVIKVEYNKLYLEIPSTHINCFNYIDSHCSKLLEDIINDNSQLSPNLDKIIDTLEMDFDYIQNVDYKSIIDPETNILKIIIFSNTTIKSGNNQISIDNINTGDFVCLLLGLDYISMLLSNDNLIARTKLYSYFIQVHKTVQVKLEQRETINNWDFTSKLKSDNIFVKTTSDENNNFDVKTENHNYLNKQDNNLFESESDQDKKFDQPIINNNLSKYSSSPSLIINDLDNISSNSK